MRTALGPLGSQGRPAVLSETNRRQPTADFKASPRLVASSGVSSTTRRPPPSSGTRITMPRPSLVTSSGPSPVRGFMAAIDQPPCIRCGRPHGVVTVSRMTGISENKGGSERPLGHGTVLVPGWGKVTVDARSALFDLYGDHLRQRDDGYRGQVPVAALVRMLA